MIKLTIKPTQEQPSFSCSQETLSLQPLTLDEIEELRETMDSLDKLQESLDEQDK